MDKNFEITNESIIKSVLTKIKRIFDMHTSIIEMKKYIAFKDINILTEIKYSKMFLNNFLKFAMPSLDKAFDECCLNFKNSSKISSLFARNMCLINIKKILQNLDTERLDDLSNKLEKKLNITKRQINIFEKDLLLGKECIFKVSSISNTYEEI